jgi:hypothetical protein
VPRSSQSPPVPKAQWSPSTALVVRTSSRRWSSHISDWPIGLFEADQDVGAAPRLAAGAGVVDALVAGEVGCTTSAPAAPAVTVQAPAGGVPPVLSVGSS